MSSNGSYLPQSLSTSGLTRRHLVRQVFIGPGALLLAPSIAQWAGFGEQQGPEMRAARILARAPLQSNGAYEAEASPVAFIIGLVGFVASVITILEYFGVPKVFAQSPNYAGAGQSAEYFRGYQDGLRNREYTSFCGVSRSSYNPDVSFLASQGGWRAELSACMISGRPVRVSGNEAEILRAALVYGKSQLGLSDVVLSKSFAPVGRKEFDFPPTIQSPVSPMAQLVLPGGGFVMYARPRTESTSIGRAILHAPFSNASALQEILIQA